MLSWHYSELRSLSVGVCWRIKVLFRRDRKAKDEAEAYRGKASTKHSLVEQSAYFQAAGWLELVADIYSHPHAKKFRPTTSATTDWWVLGKIVSYYFIHLFTVTNEKRNYKVIGDDSNLLNSSYKINLYRQYRVTNRVDLTDYAKCMQCEVARQKDK